MSRTSSRGRSIPPDSIGSADDLDAWDGDMSDAYDGTPSAADVIAEDYYRGPDLVVQGAGGVKCAHCKRYHPTTADVRWCSDLTAEMRAEAEAEQAAEAASELAFARNREAISEAGTWFGPQTEADSWGDRENVRAGLPSEPPF